MTALDACIAHRCLDADELATLRETTPADRAALAHYVQEAEGATVGCLCGRIRTDLLLARARGDRTHAERLLAALRAYLVEHGVGAGGCPDTRDG